MACFIKEKEKSTADILNDLAHPDELHLVKLLAAIDQDIPYSELQKVTHLHPVYYQKLLHIVRLGKSYYKRRSSLRVICCKKLKSMDSLTHY